MPIISNANKILADSNSEVSELIGTSTMNCQPLLIGAQVTKRPLIGSLMASVIPDAI